MWWTLNKRRIQRSKAPGPSTAKTSKNTRPANEIMWNPFWLRRMWLGAYAVLFGMLAVATLTLYLISNRRNGLGVFNDTKETVYFWKFGPTAVLVLVLALWNPVDYFTRLLQPWGNLSKGPAPASRTLLLDYVSPIQPTIIYLATRHREWPVLVTSVVAMVLSTIKVLSTGLLIIHTTDITIDKATLVRTALFDASHWNISDPLAGESVSLYNGIERENIPRPPWTGPIFAVEPFKLTKDEASLANVTYNGVTRGIYPGLECDEASFKQEPVYYNESPFTQRANVTYSTDTCEAQVTLLLGDPTQAFDRNNIWAAENYIGDVVAVQCSEEEKFLIYVTQADESLKVTNYSALICQPFYQIRNVTVYVDQYGEQHYEHLQSADTDIGSLENLDPTTAFAIIVNASNSADVSLPWVEPSGDITEANFAFLTLAAIPFTRSKPGSSYLKPLLNTSNLETSVTAAFAGILSLLVSQQILQPAADSLSGNLRYVEHRLHAQRTPSIVITVLMILCLSLTATLVIILPTKVTPTNPNSINGMASILGHTPELRKFGQISYRKAEEIIRDRNFESVAATSKPPGQRTHTFNIISSAAAESKPLKKGKASNDDKNNEKKETVSLEHEGEVRNWCPYTLKVWVRASSVALCLVIIVTLEILQQRSDRLDGLMAVTSRENGQFWATVVPAAALTGLALLYSSIYFNVTLLGPYHLLAKNSGATAKRSIASDYLGTTPLLTLPPALRQGHVATCASAFAAMAAAFLTIVVSGLYTIQSHSFAIGTTVQRYDNWNLTWPIAEGDGSAGQALQFITWRNLSEPHWSYDDLAVPTVVLPAHPAGSADQDKLTLTIPVRRAALECAATKPGDNVVSISPGPYGGSTVVYSSVTDTCSGRPGNNLPLRFSVLRSLASYDGKVQQLFFDSLGKSATVTYPDADHPFANPDNSSCPSLAMMFGSFPASDATPKGNGSLSSSPPHNFTSPDANATILACTQILYELDAEVSFLLPQLIIDPSNPPVIDEASERRVGGTYQFPVVAPLGSTFGVLSSNATFRDDISDRLGSFFAAIVHGKDGVPAHELAGEENIPRLIESVSKMYGRYMALVMSRKMRTLEPPNPASQSFPATMSQREDRLVQHRGAKIGLQALLAVMIFCGVVSWANMWKVRILPHSPSSIVGIACLLRGRSFWAASQRKTWAGDEVFKLRPGYDGRVGIYAVGGEIEPLVDSDLVPKGGVNKKAATF